MTSELLFNSFIPPQKLLYPPKQISGYAPDMFILNFELCHRGRSGMKMLMCKQALFRTTLPHPRSDHAYASYDVGEGCEMQYLVPGVDLLSERSVFVMLSLGLSVHLIQGIESRRLLCGTVRLDTSMFTRCGMVVHGCCSRRYDL